MKQLLVTRSTCRLNKKRKGLSELFLGLGVDLYINKEEKMGQVGHYKVRVESMTHK